MPVRCQLNHTNRCKGQDGPCRSQARRALRESQAPNMQARRIPPCGDHADDQWTRDLENKRAHCRTCSAHMLAGNLRSSRQRALRSCHETRTHLVRRAGVLPKPALGYACVTYPRCRMNDARQNRASILGARPMAPLLSPGQRTLYTCAARNYMCPKPRCMLGSARHPVAINTPRKHNRGIGGVRSFGCRVANKGPRSKKHPCPISTCRAVGRARPGTDLRR